MFLPWRSIWGPHWPMHQPSPPHRCSQAGGTEPSPSAVPLPTPTKPGTPVSLAHLGRVSPAVMPELCKPLLLARPNSPHFLCSLPRHFPCPPSLHTFLSLPTCLLSLLSGKYLLSTNYTPGLPLVLHGEKDACLPHAFIVFFEDGTSRAAFTS